MSTTSGISTTGASSSLCTQLTTPSSFTRLSAISCSESAEEKPSIFNISGDNSGYKSENTNHSTRLCAPGYFGKYLILSLHLKLNWLDTQR